MKRCSPGRSGTSVVHVLVVPSRDRGVADTDHWLNDPATATLFASGCTSTKRTPSGVITGEDCRAAAAHEAQTIVATIAAARAGLHMPTRD
jgi:hypothetical protein